MTKTKLSKLELVERISKIVFGTVLSGALAIFSVKVSYGVKWSELTLKRGAACFESVVKYESAIKEFELTSAKKKTLEKWYNAICENDVDQVTAATQELSTALAVLEDSEEKSKEQPVSGTTRQKQFVVVGKTSGVNGFFNFDGTTAGILTDRKEVTNGTLLYTRFSVNVRTNTERTEATRNPIQFTLVKNSCVKALGNVQQERSLYWLEIEQSEECESV